MKSSTTGRIIAVAGAVLALSGVAEARNPHCAGGIQYVVLAMRDKDKGNIEDYEREIGKAVDQLQMCAEEDPKDIEALGYLGWAYAEVDSARLAGDAFRRAIEGLQAQGDRKKAQWAITNRDHYWANWFNEGIAKITAAQKAYPDFTQPPQTAADTTLKGEAAKRYEEAIASLQRASLVRPDDPRTLRNLGTAYAFMGRYQEAEAVFREGLAAAPADSELATSLAAVRTSYAGRLVDEGKLEEAIAVYEGVVKAEPDNVDARIGKADAHFRLAQGLKDEARRREFKAAGDAYAKAASLRGGNPDLSFNAALAYQNAGENALSEAQWRATLEQRPRDQDARAALASVLVEQGKFDESIKTLHAAVMEDPRNKSLHRQLGAVYTKAGNNSKGTEELMVYLALQNGEAVADPGAVAKGASSGSAAAKTLATLGEPEQLYVWDADEERYETWFYWTQSAAFHFKKGTLVQKSDWSAPDLKSAAGAGSGGN